jgi:hypothetical protein
MDGTYSIVILCRDTSTGRDIMVMERTVRSHGCERSFYKDLPVGYSGVASAAAYAALESSEHSYVI